MSIIDSCSSNGLEAIERLEKYKAICAVEVM